MAFPSNRWRHSLGHARAAHRALRVPLHGERHVNPDRTSLDWIAARKRHHLSHSHVQMARELGMNPEQAGQDRQPPSEPWKLPLPRFIEELYEKRFGKTRPDVVTRPSKS